MPTYFTTAQFEREYAALTEAQRRLFRAAVRKFVDDLRRGGFRKSLRIKGYRGQEGVFEMTWAGNGRALFCYGEEVMAGEPHIIWLRVGGHDIF